MELLAGNALMQISGGAKCMSITAETTSAVGTTLIYFDGSKYFTYNPGDTQYDFYFNLYSCKLIIKCADPTSCCHIVNGVYDINCLNRVDFCNFACEF
jgi:hypothetical protein